MKRLMLICLLLGWLLPDAMAQRQVSGKVTDPNTNEELPGVTVLVKGTSTGTVTDIEGNYKIQVPGPEATLVFSFIGYITQEVPVGNRSTVDVSLSEDVKQLEEVVVVGYGTQKKSDLTGAVASVSGDRLRNTLTANVDQALQGRVPGVQVTQNSGRPGSAVSIRVRGTSSITGSNEPLYVIDGVQIQGDGAGTAGFDWGGGAGGQQRNAASPLAALDPNDIESIEVLKDASATAIYGSRAANGVVIITTKRGKKGDATISYNGTYGIQQLPKKLDMMNLRQYADYNTQIANDIQNIEVNERLRDPSLLGTGTDWQDAVFQQAPIQTHSLSVTGGTDKTSYAIMGGFFKQEGIIIGSGFERFNIRTNLESQVKDWVKVGANIAFSNTDEVITLSDGGDGVIAQALQTPPTIPVRQIDGTFGGPPVGQGGSAQVGANPVALALVRNNTLARQTINTNFYADAKIIEGLNFRTELGFNQNHGLSKAFIPTYEWGTFVNDLSQLKHRNDQGFGWQFRNYLTYNRTFDVHSLTAMVGQEAIYSSYEGSEFFKMNFATNAVQTPNQGDNSNIPINGWMGANSLTSYYGRVNYNFADRYLVTATMRGDGSSRFGPNNRWGYFPSASVAWRVANESFMPDSRVLTDLKLRASWGLTGNQGIPNYAFGSSLRGINSAYGMSYINNRIANPDVQWESTETFNVGMNISLWNNRVTLEADAYQRFTDGMLLQVAIPNYMGGGGGGIGAPYANVGGMENKGLEFGLNTINVAAEKFNWSTNVNFTMNRNMITQLDRTYFQRLYWYSGFDQVTRTMVGHPVGTFYGYVYDGIFTSEEQILNAPVQVAQDGAEVNYFHERDGVYLGDVKFKDINGDGVVDSKDQTIIGDPNPRFTFGLNNSISYGGFDLSVFLQGVYGVDIFNYQRVRNEGMMSIFDNQSVTVANRARIAQDEAGNDYIINPETDMPRFAQLNTNANNRMSDRWIEDGSYLRVQNVTLSYTLPRSLTRRASVERLRVYANATNLYTFTNYTGYDPEIGAFEQNAMMQNIDMGRFPAPRIITFGVNLDF
jgi:TonB-linked SusC/RagA family outer membrane protein